MPHGAGEALAGHEKHRQTALGLETGGEEMQVCKEGVGGRESREGRGGGGVGRVCVRGWRTSCNICPCTPELTSPPHSPPNTNYDLQAFTFVHFRINARITVGHAEDKVFLNNNCCIYYKALGDFTSSIKSIKISILPSLHTATPPLLRNFTLSSANILRLTTWLGQTRALSITWCS